MKHSRKGPAPITIPSYWPPHEALAVFELINQLRGLIWRTRGSVIQRTVQPSHSTSQTPIWTATPRPHRRITALNHPGQFSALTTLETWPTFDA